MAHAPSDKKPVAQTIAYGIATTAIYAGVFSFADTITALFAKGALWAAGPIVTVFAVSWVHGQFAHNLWTCLGVTARLPRAEVRPTVQPVARPQVRATLNA